MGWKRRIVALLRRLRLTRFGIGLQADQLTTIDWDNVRVEGGFAVSHFSPERIEVAGQPREYAVYLPDQYDGQEPLPLVFNLHAYNAFGRKQERISRMIPLAEKHGFILVYPNALGEPAQWNYRPGLENNADLQFYVRLMDELPGRINIDTSRIFVMGLSNGGGMAHRVACDLGERIAGIATVAGVYPAISVCNTEKPVPIIAFHGNADIVVPFKGKDDGGWLSVDSWAARVDTRPGLRAYLLIRYLISNNDNW